LSLLKFNKFKYFIPVIIYSFVIFYLSHQEKIEYLNFDFAWEDKVKHFVAYFIYGLLLILPFAKKYNVLEKKHFLIILSIGISFGISDEIHQYFIPGRYCEFLDFVADGLGVLVSILIYKKYFKLNINK